MKPSSISVLSLLAILIIIVCCPIAYCDQNEEEEDVVYLKNGEVIRGSIVKLIYNHSLKIKIADGIKLVFRMDEVERFVKKPSMNASKNVRINREEDIYYLTNGEVIHGNIVDRLPNDSLRIKSTDGSTSVYHLSEIERREEKSSMITPTEDKEEVIYLKNGEVIHGKIIERLFDNSLKIKTADGNEYIYHSAEIERFTQNYDPKNPYKDNRIMNQSYHGEKDGGLAFLLSLLFPGGGQYYNGEGGKGTLMLGMAVLGVVLIPVEDNGSGKPSSTADIGAVMLFGSILWSLIDAPISSAKINRRNEMAYACSISDNLFVDFGITKLDKDKRTFARVVVEF